MIEYEIDHEHMDDPDTAGVQVNKPPKRVTFLNDLYLVNTKWVELTAEELDAAKKAAAKKAKKPKKGKVRTTPSSS